MNFEDEPYVRLYVRDTKTWLRLGFEGQCVLMFLLRKLDKAGVLDGMEELVSDVALVTGVPEAIVAVGMPRLLGRGVFQWIGDRLIMPNYIEAQTAIRTDKARQRDMREKRVAQARLVTPRDSSVTPRDEVSREPTPDHGSSHGVTLYCTDLCSTELSADPERARPHVASAEPVPEPDTPCPAAPAVANDLAPPEPSRPRATARTYDMPEGPPPQEYLDEAWIARVSREQAISTWEHYQVAKLPLDGVPRLHPWLLAQAKTYAQRHPAQPARASPRGRGQNPRASKQPDAGMTGLEGVEIVNGIAVPRTRPAEELPG